MTDPTIDLNQLDFNDEILEDDGVVFASIYVGGVLHHLTFIEVEEGDEPGTRVQACPELVGDELLDNLYGAFQPTDPYQTVQLPGFPDREFVCFMDPGC